MDPCFFLLDEDSEFRRDLSRFSDFFSLPFLFNLLVDVEEANLVHGRKFCDQVDHCGQQVHRERRGSIVCVVGAKQEPRISKSEGKKKIPS